MKKSFIYASLLAAVIPGGIIAAGTAPTVVRTQKGTVVVTPVTDNIFRVATLPAGAPLSLPESQSAILEADAPGVHSFIGDKEVILQSPTTKVTVDRQTGTVSFYDNEGDLLLSEAIPGDNASSTRRLSFLTDPEENFYGTGERAHSIRLNGDSLHLWNRANYGYGEGDPRNKQMNINMPYFLSDIGYGVLIDDYNKADLILGDTITYLSDTPKPLSYYFINGDGSLAGTTSAFTQLTGRQDLPPFWTLGYITSKYGYGNQQEALGVIDTLRNHNFPVDGMVLDLYWYGVETDMGRLDWDKNKWADHKKMVDDLKKQGVNLVVINQPYINKKGAIDNYNELASKGMLTKNADGNIKDVTTWVGEAGMFDITNPDTRQWMWNRLSKLTADGLAGWWGDLGEPEVHPLEIVHANGEPAQLFHNAYGNEWARLIYEGLRKDFPDQRPMLLMRGGTAGLQRYSVFPWSSDVARTWEGLEPQVKIMLNSGLSGLGYMSSDIGGFATSPDAPLDPELYLRWIQLGSFTPMLRTHAQRQPEPYHFPSVEKEVLNYVKMRYQWLPYNYTLAYDNSAEGLPMARPLNFYDSDPRYANVTDEYLWGQEVLVAPVLKKGMRSRKVLFPEGEWIDYNNPTRKYRGGTSATVKAPLGEMPLFVRAGAFIPLCDEPIKNVEQYNPQMLTVKYYPSAEESSYTLFDDNRKSPTSLHDGEYQLTTFTGRREGKALEIGLSTNGGKYAGMPSIRMITMEIVGTPRPASVDLGDIKLEPKGSPKQIRQYGYHYDAARQTLTVRFPWDYAATTLTIK